MEPLMWMKGRRDSVRAGPRKSLWQGRPRRRVQSSAPTRSGSGRGRNRFHHFLARKMRGLACAARQALLQGAERRKESLTSTEPLGRPRRKLHERSVLETKAGAKRVASHCRVERYPAAPDVSAPARGDRKTRINRTGRVTTNVVAESVLLQKVQVGALGGASCAPRRIGDPLLITRTLLPRSFRNGRYAAGRGCHVVAATPG